MSFLLMALTRALSRVFFRLESRWVGTVPPEPWRENIRILVLLNHTSLFEPLYTSAMPVSFLRRLARHHVVPGADKTLSRPWVGRFLRWLCPGAVPVSRRRDETWTAFLDAIGPQSIVMVAPEGRMKRPGGVDSEGNPMTVRGGIADVLRKVEDGGMVIFSSAGLHHVQRPGERRVRVFQRLRLDLEFVDISRYRTKMGIEDPQGFKDRVTSDFQARLGRCPKL